ncbi:MAG: omega-3 polyunsaturated fatty acid synthase subunit protein [Gammaproteobacteria bacterium]|jgi:3-hydroxymyristoyl/3-hydroxydecanoyl-(acyl carrier protein) dehydratase|nr:omega-3 polyunsaturated fatty acid synthase subunit protein [Gammaproteobacteria bacterium]
MKKSIEYELHFKPIVFPALSEPEKIVSSDYPPQVMAPPSTASATTITLNTPTPLAQTSAESLASTLSQMHMQFLTRQMQLYQHHQGLQQFLFQNILQLASATVADLPIPESPAQETVAVSQPSLPGPKFSREDLEHLASGNISELFGDWFKPLDQYDRLIRMPEPPLLLADRVTGIRGEPNSKGTGTIWTETDVREDAWYLHNGRMPMGITIEAGQADLLLASWLGFDFDNKGERIYRLLGCEMSLHGERPKPGDTLCFDIHIDGQAKQGNIRLFFFHYDCHINGKLCLKVRHGQAGFFTDQELADSGGVLWDAAEEKIDPSLPLDPPYRLTQNRTFSKEQLVAFSEGDAFACFGPGFERTQAHTQTPSISNKKMLFLDEITDFDPQGGPGGRGYMRGIQNISPDDWFFKGHFKNDPCMPGTLMLEGGLQVAIAYLTALGYTINRDGWRFEPVTDQVCKLRCRGQVQPSSKQVVYEIFVYSIVSEPYPTLYADLLGTADGLKAFHTKIGLRLVPDWPLTDRHPLLLNHVEKTVPPVVNGFAFDFRSLLACAWGKPSEAFGALYQPFDSHRTVARLPGPPYHFITRVLDINANIGAFQKGGEVVFEYDVPLDAWYFSENGYPTMPFCVMLEAALQPCGWFASYVGSALRSSKDLLFRNLDGTATWKKEVLPSSGTLRTQVKLKNLSESAGMMIESFDVNCTINDECVYSMDTVFGFFPHDAFENQAGLVPPSYEENVLQRASDYFVDLTTQPEQYFLQAPNLMPKPMLLMIDRVTGYWEESGTYCAQLRAEKTVDPGEWFFKAHFMGDPVQPGSLGVEAMIQLLQFYMLKKGMHKGLKQPHFEPLAMNCPLTWKYRGQIIPENKIISTVVNIRETGQDDHGVYAIAEASLWVDGKRVYEAKNLGMRLVES